MPSIYGAARLESTFSRATRRDGSVFHAGVPPRAIHEADRSELERRPKRARVNATTISKTSKPLDSATPHQTATPRAACRFNDFFGL
jgi:hypothetical protein